MMKEARNEQDLHAIQTSVAFKNISDAVEQYRRQFGIAFLALIAFSAIHVGLVVVANMYTLETRVDSGVLKAATAPIKTGDSKPKASGSSSAPEAVAPEDKPVATGKAEQTKTLDYIMSNLDEAAQREHLSNMDSVDFIDRNGNYRKYTVTGFELGGYKRGDLKLYTSVGHILAFVRGKGLQVHTENSCNHTELLQQFRDGADSMVRQVVREENGALSESGESAGRRRLLTGRSLSQTWTTNLMNSANMDLAPADRCMDRVIAQVMSDVQSSGSATAIVQGQSQLQTGFDDCYSSIGSNLGEEGEEIDANGLREYALYYINMMLNHIMYEDYGSQQLSQFSQGNEMSLCFYDVLGDEVLGTDCVLGEIDYKKVGASFWDEDYHLMDSAFQDQQDCVDSISRFYYRRMFSSAEVKEAFVDRMEAETIDTLDSLSNQIQFILDNGLLGQMETIAEGTYDAATNSVCHNGSCIEVPGRPKCSECGGATGDSYLGLNGKKAADFENVLGQIMDAAFATLSTDITDCIGHNVATAMVAMVPMLQTAKNWFSDETKYMKAFDELMERKEKIELEAYELEQEMSTAVVPGCAKAVKACWFGENIDQILGFWNLQIRTLWDGDWGMSGSPYQFDSKQFPSMCIPELLLAENDRFASAGQGYGSLSLEASIHGLAMNAESDIIGTFDSFGDDSWERCRPCLKPGVAGSTCTSRSVFDHFYEEQSNNFRMEREAADDWMAVRNAMEAEEASFNARMGNFGGDHSDILTRTEFFLQEAVNVHIPAIKAEVEASYDNYRDTNVWKTFKEAGELSDMSDSYLNWDYYGCSDQKWSDIYATQSRVEILGLDACQVKCYTEGASTSCKIPQGGMEGPINKHRKPFMSGVMFSSLLGGFENYALYLPFSFCSGLAANQGEFFAGDNKNAAEYVVMLHGWGGSSTFLHMSAAVIYYANVGIPSASMAEEAELKGTGELAFYACNVEADMTMGCKMGMAPGGFIVIAPDGASCPLSLKTWWANGDFAGFLADFVAFELPAFLTMELFQEPKRMGMFGFSMGSYGTLNVLGTYPMAFHAFGAFNGPVYPGRCFFMNNCHHLCSADIVMCELEFTSVGMSINAYVIIFKNSLVTSLGTMDPVGVGVAEHMRMQHSSGLAERVVQCGKMAKGGGWVGDSNSDVSKVDKDNLIWSYFGAMDVSSKYDACSWQWWRFDGESCDKFLDANKLGSKIGYDGGEVIPDGGSFTSVRVTLAGFGGEETGFSCTTGGCKMANMGELPLQTSMCPMFGCDALTWCIEADLSSGSGSYLLPVHSLVAASKFVPTSNPISGQSGSMAAAGQPVPSAYAKFSLGSPLLKYFYNEAMYDSYPMLLYMHCSQNDEFDLFTPHKQYAQMLVVNEPFMNDNSFFAVDFLDCDWHRFSENDMKRTLFWFSDAFRSYSGDPFGLGDAFGVAGAGKFALCFLSSYGFIPSYGSGSLGAGGFDTKTALKCGAFTEAIGNLVSFKRHLLGYSVEFYEYVLNKGSNCLSDGFCTGQLPSMYTKHDWDYAHSFNEHTADTTTLADIDEDLDLLSTGLGVGSICKVDFSSKTGDGLSSKFWEQGLGGGADVCTSDQYLDNVPTEESCWNSVTQWMESDFSSNKPPDGCFHIFPELESMVEPLT